MSRDFDDLARSWAKGVIRSEMVQRKLTFGDLANLLKTIRVKEDEHTLRNKVARGTFSAGFFAQCLAVMGVKTLRIDLFDRVAEAEFELPPAKDDPEPTMEEILRRIRTILAEK